NTSGGIIIIGVQDKSKEILGLKNPLLEEEKLANAISDSISPLIVPEIELVSYRNKELLIIRVPHVIGPFFLKKEGLDHGTYVRFGSTNRLVDEEMMASLKLIASNRTFDELPFQGEIDNELAKTAFQWVKKELNNKTYQMLGIYTDHFGKQVPTIGGILLFGKNRQESFPDAIVRLACFQGNTKEKIIDSIEIISALPFAVSESIKFIERHVSVEAKIGKIFRTDIPQYPPFAIREALINALVHTDYSMKGCHIQVAIFANRIEITNPGGLPFGQTLKKALSGYSRLRNRVIGRVFRELKLIEQWGSGLQRIIETCKKIGLQDPLFEEENNQFRITLFSSRKTKVSMNVWEKKLVDYLQANASIKPQEAAKLWKISDRAARNRLKKMIVGGFIVRISTSEKDPYSIFVLAEKYLENDSN
ncbi:MAG: ATP-binding protein, partial [Parachlamydiales bacterium]